MFTSLSWRCGPGLEASKGLSVEQNAGLIVMKQSTVVPGRSEPWEKRKQLEVYSKCFFKETG